MVEALVRRFDDHRDTDRHVDWRIDYVIDLLRDSGPDRCCDAGAPARWAGHVDRSIGNDLLATQESVAGCGKLLSSIVTKVREFDAMRDPKTEFEQAGEQKPLTLPQEFWLFLRQNKKWWLLPILLSFAVLGALVALGSTGAAPFIYTLF